VWVLAEVSHSNNTSAIPSIVTSDSLLVTRSPSTRTVYTAEALTLTCVTAVNPAVDTPLQVIHRWVGPGGVVTAGNSVGVSSVTGSGWEYTSSVIFTSVRSSHSGTYTCSSTVSPLQSSVFIGSSAVQTASTSFTAGIP
jgi:hypothetical protein